MTIPDGVLDTNEQGGWSGNPDDDKFIATALQVRDAVLVSGDSDLLTAQAPAGLPILTPAQAMAPIQGP